MKYIPRKTKVKVEFYKGLTLFDIIFALICAAIFMLIITSNLSIKLYLALSWLAFSVMFFMPIADDLKLYSSVGLLFKFFAYNKKYTKHPKSKRIMPVSMLIPYEDIDSERFLNYGDYYGMVVEVKPIEFFLLTEEKQNMIIRTFGNALSRIVVGQSAQIVKINKAILYDQYIINDERKFETLSRMSEKGEVSDAEVDARAEVFNTRVSAMINANENNRVYRDHFYIVVYDKDKTSLETTIDGIIRTMIGGQVPIKTSVVEGRELSIFLKAQYTKDFDERDTENMSTVSLAQWTLPENVTFRTNTTKVEGKDRRVFNITDYPLSVPNAWGYSIFSMPDTKVVVNINPIARFDAEKMIDKTILEVESKALRYSRTSKQIEIDTHLSTLRQLLVDIKNSNENLINTNIYIDCAEYVKKDMRALLRQQGFRYSELFGRQVEGFINSNISKLDTLKSSVRGINTTSLAAIFPFISGALMDEAGFFIGSNDRYGDIFVDFFRRDNERVNSNMMIIGKSGGGKSFATKTLLANMAADNSKIFILDPEQEYDILAKNLCGKAIDVGSGLQGRINPFHITPSLQGEEGDIQDDYNAHLQFLEQYFRVILSGISSDAFEKVNSLLIEMYNEKGINSNTNLSKLSADDFPIFDDLYRIIIKKKESEKDEYIRRMYQIIEIYVQKFASGGRNANLWNGPTSLETKENMVVFSFRSLLANQNMVLANAQMLLVLRYLNNEIIKNKEWNAMMGFNNFDSERRKIIVAVDEAHVFIDDKYPIALNFMEQLAKRIRKYDGMQIIITQNIKDFVGSPDIAKQSTAIINASQFSMIFGLAPNDMTDLVELYRNAGGINDDEKDAIVTAGRGEAFFITSPQARTSLKIVAFDAVRALFEKKKK